MLFKELIQQHGVYRLVAHREDLTFGIMSHQSGADLFYFLSHETKLWGAIGIDCLFVTECYRLERENRFDCLVHGLDLILETLRRRCNAKLSAAVYKDSRPGNRCPTDAGDKRSRLDPLSANADSVGLASDTWIGDINIVITYRQVYASVNTQCNVCVASRIVYERLRTNRRVGVAHCIFKQGTETNSCVAIAVAVVKERLKTKGGVPDAGGTTIEGLNSLSSVGAWVAAIRCRRHCLGSGREPKAGKHERDGKESSF